VLKKILTQKNGSAPPAVIMVTGHGDEEVATEALKCGAIDYIPKRLMTAEGLLRAISNVREKIALRHILDDQRRQLEEQARQDPLTKLMNRRELMNRLGEEIKRASRYRHPLSVLMIDLDHFKAVNDNHGHPVGDDVLIGFASILRMKLRETDQIGRVGGEEFLIFLPETGIERATEVAEKIRQAAASNLYYNVAGGSFQVTCSIGIVDRRSFDRPHDTQSCMRLRAQMYHWADTALYAAKKAGRNCVRVFDANPDEIDLSLAKSAPIESAPPPDPPNPTHTPIQDAIRMIDEELV
jgi:diguanylate cyclase (GGDEF)-like protein